MDNIDWTDRELRVVLSQNIFAARNAYCADQIFRVEWALHDELCNCNHDIHTTDFLLFAKDN